MRYARGIFPFHPAPPAENGGGLLWCRAPHHPRIPHPISRHQDIQGAKCNLKSSIQPFNFTTFPNSIILTNLHPPVESPKIQHKTTEIGLNQKEMTKPYVSTCKLIVILISLQSMIQLFVNSQNSDEHAHEVHCSRERSRTAYKIIEEYLIPFVEQENYQMSHKCKLHPGNDMFRDQEEHKIHVDINEWRCAYCKKSFRAEKFLDQHFDNRHYNLLNVSHNCLADLCGALHCDHVVNSVVPKTKCNPAAAKRNRHLCESLADSCFPVHQGPSASRLHELFLRQFCDAHSCSGKIKPFPRGGRKHTSIFYLAISILILLLLPLFYVIVFLYQREMRKGTQVLRRISKPSLKKKPS